jgi:hypothetical protein
MLREQRLSMQNGKEIKRNAKTKRQAPCGHLPSNAVKNGCTSLVLDCVLQSYYIEAPEAAAALAAFLCDFLCIDFFVVFLADEAAGAAEAASGAEACAKAAVANRPATRAAISFFML